MTRPEGAVPGPNDVMLALRARGDLKVWSLLVTLFGDAAMDPGATLSGPQISEVLRALQIRPEAQRVALHRLRKEDWITATRQGRIGIYALSDTGRRETQAVAERVYADAVAPAQTRYLVVTPDGGDAPDQALLLGNCRYLGAAPGSATDLSAPLSGPLPPWVAATALPARLTQDLTSLYQSLPADPVAPADPSDPAEATALRLLILHQWRRLALRLPPQADALLGPDWIGAACRTRVAHHLCALPPLTPTRPKP